MRHSGGCLPVSQASHVLLSYVKKIVSDSALHWSIVYSALHGSAAKENVLDSLLLPLCLQQQQRDSAYQSRVHRHQQLQQQLMRGAHRVSPSIPSGLRNGPAPRCLTQESRTPASTCLAGERTSAAASGTPVFPSAATTARPATAAPSPGPSWAFPSPVRADAGWTGTPATFCPGCSQADNSRVAYVPDSQRLARVPCCCCCCCCCCWCRRTDEEMARCDQGAHQQSAEHQHLHGAQSRSTTRQAQAGRSGSDRGSTRGHPLGNNGRNGLKNSCSGYSSSDAGTLGGSQYATAGNPATVVAKQRRGRYRTAAVLAAEDSDAADIYKKPRPSVTSRRVLLQRQQQHVNRPGSGKWENLPSGRLRPVLSSWKARQKPLCGHEPNGLLKHSHFSSACFWKAAGTAGVPPSVRSTGCQACSRDLQLRAFPDTVH